ncbi:MAG: hypothetical protein RBJ76_15340 [Stenomitos frigidus ULC029]
MGQWKHAIEKERPASNLSARGWTDRVLLPVWKLYEEVRSKELWQFLSERKHTQCPLASLYKLYWTNLEKAIALVAHAYCQQKRFKF